MLKREKDIQALMADGVSRQVICEEIAKKYRVSPKTIEDQYYKIVNAMSKVVDEGREELRANLIARQDLIYKKSMEEGKYKTALDSTVAQAKMGGLFEKADAASKQPEVITIKETDFSQGLAVLEGEKAENE